jgi:hypothetical protein
LLTITVERQIGSRVTALRRKGLFDRNLTASKNPATAFVARIQREAAASELTSDSRSPHASRERSRNA